MSAAAFDSRRGRGFTLIEILIVVVILGILAAIIIPQFADASQSSAQATFVTNIKTYAESAQRYRIDTGDFLEDSSSGQLPAGFDAYVNPVGWTQGTPIGGVWDSEFDSFGILSGLGVHFNGFGTTQNDAYMQEIDALFDDGVLTTGAFRKIASDRYYFVIADY